MTRNSGIVLRAFALVVLLTTVPALAGARFRINNNDGTNEGFNDPSPAAPVGGNNGTTIGQQRLIAFQRAAEIWAGVLDSDVEIVINARFDPLECDATSAVLGSAGTIDVASDFPGAPLSATWYSLALANRLAGEDLQPAFADINATFNSDLGKPACLPGAGFYYGLDHNHGNETDLLVVLLHEFGHGLGFQSFFNRNTGALFEGQLDIYTSYLFDNATNKRWSEMTDSERRISSTNNSRVVLDGPSVVADTAKFLEGNGPSLVTVTDPSSIAGSYSASRAQFGGNLAGGPVSGSFVLALDPNDSLGPSTSDGCSALTNASVVAGKIALVDRGDCTFVIKAKNVQNAGAIAVVVVNNETNSNLPPLGGSDPTITVPVFGITKADGDRIKAQLAGGVTGRLEIGPSTGLAGADGSNRARVFAPSPFQPGSSISHYDRSASPNLLMEPNISPDLGSRVDLTQSYFRDAGWFAPSTMSLTMKDSLVVDADSDGNADPGDRIRYLVNVTNTGGAGATSVVLSNTPDSNTTLVTGSVQTSSGSVTKGNGASDATIQIALTGLKPGATVTAQFDVTVKSGISSDAIAIANQASLTGSNFSTIPSDDPDTTNSNDSTSTPLDLNPVKVDKSVLVAADADASGGVTAGDTLRYSITVRNGGSTTINGAVLTDTPDVNTTLVPGSVTTSQGSISSGNDPGATTVNVSLGAIAPGATATVALSVTVDSDIPTRTVLILNQATVTSSNFPAVLSNDPRNTVPNDATGIGVQPVRKRTTRR